MSLDRVPELGSKPVDLKIRLSAPTKVFADDIVKGLHELYKASECTDVELICADRAFPAHRVVLASQSAVFRQGLASVSGDGTGRQIRLAEIDNPEAVKFMLDFIYQVGEAAIWQDYNPQTQEINKDVLRLAKNFQLPGLSERAMHWMAKDINTGNVVERLTICEDFELIALKDKILGQLTNNKRALFEVAHSPQIMAYPKLMQALLQQAAGQVEEEPTSKGKKRKSQ